MRIITNLSHLTNFLCIPCSPEKMKMLINFCYFDGGSQIYYYYFGVEERIVKLNELVQSKIEKAKKKHYKHKSLDTIT